MWKKTSITYVVSCKKDGWTRKEKENISYLDAQIGILHKLTAFSWFFCILTVNVLKVQKDWFQVRNTDFWGINSLFTSRNVKHVILEFLDYIFQGV